MSTLEDAVRALHSQPTITVKEAALVLGMGERVVRTAIASGDIEVLRLGRNIRVLSEPLKKRLAIGE